MSYAPDYVPEQLKPCDFCGGDIAFLGYHSSEGLVYDCVQCGTRTIRRIDLDRKAGKEIDRVHAPRQWNQRKELKAVYAIQHINGTIPEILFETESAAREWIRYLGFSRGWRGFRVIGYRVLDDEYVNRKIYGARRES